MSRIPVHADMHTLESELVKQKVHESEIYPNQHNEYTCTTRRRDGTEEAQQARCKISSCREGMNVDFFLKNVYYTAK